MFELSHLLREDNSVGRRESGCSLVGLGGAGAGRRHCKGASGDLRVWLKHPDPHLDVSHAYSSFVTVLLQSRALMMPRDLMR